MNTQAEPATSVADIVKQVFSVVFVVAGVAAFYYFSTDHTYFKEVRLLYRVLGLVVIVLMALGMMLTTDLGRTVWSFVLESKQEVRKVVWPTREETMRTTLLVFAMVFIVGLILWLLDMFLFWGVRILTGQGG
ncbi:MAG: preprotein translocase subunit SecE [Methylococcaceae bacterium]|jgi:preprotein translocase subunit SecE|nr:preprotein translocase subunit SecE [Methylococcaceae bacterium]MDD1640287.1 preprotein translocase subunit SecE [Methylococcaceae bacterium]OYV23282.1 MAG: preprotein translocase subunit SecE [Methylococcaceae bacterium NSO1]